MAQGVHGGVRRMYDRRCCGAPDTFSLSQGMQVTERLFWGLAAALVRRCEVRPAVVATLSRREDC